MILKNKSLSDNIKKNDENILIYERFIIYQVVYNNITLCDILNELKNNLDDLYNKENDFKLM